MDKETKILILGAKGMLGQDLARILANSDNLNACPPKQSVGGAEFNLTLWDREDIDISDEYQVNKKIGDLKPAVIINCAAYTAVDDCETNKDLALGINNRAVGYLAFISKNINAIIIHISTDYVFNGLNAKGYAEDSQEFGPVNFYGETKLLGEKTLKNITNKYYLVRTSWLYGQGGQNFVATMLKLGKEKSEVKVVNDQFGKPTYTVDLAQQILYILNNNLDFGIYHVTSETKEGGISWYDFCQEIFRQSNLTAKVIPCTSQEFIRPAKRPAHSVLINTKLPALRNWEEALKDYLSNK